MRLEMFGEYDAINDRLQSLSPLLNKGDFTGAARRMIEMEIEAIPARIGPPVSIIEITSANGIRWIDHGSCPAMPQPLNTK
jgi:hypothetical protein